MAPTGFRPPSADGTDRVLALRAIIDAKGHALPNPPRCHGYANCCGCPVCALREQRFRAARSEASYLRYIGFDEQPEEERVAA